MVGKLDPEERVLPEWFEQTSNEPYVRHEYKLIYSNGQSVTHDTWEDLRNDWWNTPAQFLSHVEVLDRKQTNKKSNGGFK